MKMRVKPIRRGKPMPYIEDKCDQKDREELKKKEQAFKALLEVSKWALATMQHNRTSLKIALEKAVAQAKDILE